MHLQIFVGKHCANCAEAFRIAELARSIDGLDVDVIDLDEPGQHAPVNVVAVPTYVLDGRVVSLGNPYPDVFLTQLRNGVKGVMDSTGTREHTPKEHTR